MFDWLRHLIAQGLGNYAAPGVKPKKGPGGAPLIPMGGSDFLTKEQMFEGVHIFGATGSGKTTGSGQAIAVRLLKAGFGGLVLTAKSEEVETWRGYMAAAGRSNDLYVLEPGGAYCFNFLEYERRVAAELLERKGSSQRRLTDNLVALFCTIMEVSQRSSGQGSNDNYWMGAVRQLLRNAIDLLSLSGEAITMQNLYELVTSAPTNIRYVEDEEADYGIAWRDNSFCWECSQKVVANLQKDGVKKAWEHPDLKVARITYNYWFHEFPNLAEETRSIIVSYFTAVADGFLRGIFNDLFCPEVNTALKELTPEDTHEGKVIVLNIPVKEFNEMGQFAQVLYKFVWQRATERRNLKEPGQVPIFLWADEAQFFITSQDMLFQTTARSKRAATIYLTQNISNYYAVLPGERGRAETDSLLGNFQTKIFHANGDSVTNKWAAELIGSDWIPVENTSTKVSSRNASDSSSDFGSSLNHTMAYQVIPAKFTTLRKGGEDFEFKVEAYIFQGGRSWSNCKNYKGVVFTQEFFTAGATARG